MGVLELMTENQVEVSDSTDHSIATTFSTFELAVVVIGCQGQSTVEFLKLLFFYNYSLSRPSSGLWFDNMINSDRRYTDGKMHSKYYCQCSYFPAASIFFC